jgi:hypothetical protein
MTARLIERAVRRLYAEDALRRISTLGSTTGSHVAGVFNRAAKEFEKEVAAFATRELGIDVRDKAPLGELGNKLRGHLLRTNLSQLTDLVDVIAEVNSHWVRVKHREDPPVEDLVGGLGLILRGFDLIGFFVSPITNPPQEQSK